MTAEERRKASGPLIYWAAAAPAHRGAATVGAPFGAPPPSWGSKDVLGSKDMASRPFEASFLGKRERWPGCEPHRGNAVPRRHGRACGGDERCVAVWYCGSDNNDARARCRRALAFFRHREAGEGDHWSSRSERTVVEGARDSALRCRCKGWQRWSCFCRAWKRNEQTWNRSAVATSALRRCLRPLHHPASQGGPPPPLSRWRMKSDRRLPVGPPCRTRPDGRWRAA